MLGLSGTTSSLYLTMSKMYMTASLMDSPLQSSQPRTFNFGLDQSIFFPSHWLTSSTHDYRPLYNEDIFIFISSFVIFFSHELQVIWKIWLMWNTGRFMASSFYQVQSSSWFLIAVNVFTAQPLILKLRKQKSFTQILPLPHFPHTISN